MRRQSALVAIAAAAVCALALGALPSAFAGSTADPGISSTTIVLGGTSPLTGPAAAYASVARGAKAYLDSVNAKGGVAKRKFEYKIVDDAYNPAQSIQATRQLVEQDKVFAVFNSLGTEQNIAVREYLNQTKVPQLFVASGATTWGRDAAKYPWTIGFQPSYQAEGWVYGQYISKTLKKARIAVLVQNDDYGKDLLAGLKRGLGRSGSKVVAAESYEVTAPDVQSQVAKLKSSGANVFAIFATPKFAIQAFVYANRLAWRAPDHQQLRLRGLEHHAARFRGRKEQVDRGRDLAQLPQGPDRPEVEERPWDEDLPLGHVEVREGRERERRLPRIRHGGRVRDRLALQAPGSEPDACGAPRTRALDHEPGQPVPASWHCGQDRQGRQLPDPAGPAPALDEGQVGAVRWALGVEPAVTPHTGVRLKPDPNPSRRQATRPGSGFSLTPHWRFQSSAIGSTSTAAPGLGGTLPANSSASSRLAHSTT